jgi:hypothetical protein
MVIAFHRRFQKFMKMFILKQNDIFGKVTDYWWRMEYQKRGGIHIHMVIWCDKEKLAQLGTKISAEMPRFDPSDPVLKNLTPKALALWRDKVWRNHRHTCREVRCFRGPQGKRLKQCKQGFPFQLNDEEKLDKSGVRYLYVRRQAEDAEISSYILELVMMWDGHVNVQRVTDCGWEMYLAKYIAKSEAASNIKLVQKKTGKRLSNSGNISDQNNK